MSGPSIARRAAEALATDAGGSRLGSIPANELTAVDVYEAAAAGDPLADEIVEDVGRQLAWAIHLLVMAYDVDRVVLGGGVSHAGDTFMAPDPARARRLRAASPTRRASCCPPGVVDGLLPVGADAGALGAVAIAQQRAPASMASEGPAPTAERRWATFSEA